jgi:DNA end-binding protein Ku
VMRAREYLAIVRAREGVLSLTTMRFADEIRSTDSIDTATGKAARPTRKQLEAATAVIEELTTDWEPDNYTDRYRQRLQRVVTRKRKGETIAAPEPPEKIQAPPDLMEALEKTLAELSDRGRGRRGGAAKSKRSKQTA